MKLQRIIIPFMIAPLLFGCANNQKNNEKTDSVETEKENVADNTSQNETSNNDSSEQQENTSSEDQGITLEKKYFNEVEEVNGQAVIKNVENLLVLVNKEIMLPSDYIPSDLVRPNVAFSFGDQDIEKSYMKQVAADALEAMFAQAKAEGVNLFAVSGYRSYARQDQVFQAEVAAKGEEKAMEAVAVPGQSEHQTGLAMDISGASVDYLLTESFEDTAEGKWLAENAHKFGFILRYPKGKESITGYKYEPWHFRYVGEEMATIIYEHDWTLEEFFEEAKAI
ncbi:M15 family metallopeptidase [Caldibacillus lycopersici]|uniref:M15 family metallopeptidase n=1 Tax=Perspicuibacillus lycopersici TaxID=1325689 RepID=A0AAE3IS42_9BACI|nr:M15 family metallopeptidase [Perspicuibacillus lycopersici]MCU9613613.1 M15 family metallopeptidase [Perspicuibacillus lycopersici]